MKQAHISSVWPQAGRTLVLFLALFLVSLSVTGCAALFGAPEEEPKLPIDMAQVVPAEWQPIGDFRRVSVDNDPTGEYLLLYRYDSPGEGKPAPVGGVIYDTQTNPYSQWRAIPIPSNPAAQLVPYQLLPSYWDGAGQGYLADPNVGDGQVRVVQVKRTGAEEKMGAFAEPWEPEPLGEEGKPVEKPVFDELVILGGRKRISVFWWKSKREGYGVAHVAASGWLETPGWKPDEMAEKERQATKPKEAPPPIKTILAYYPLNDRSALCWRSTFIRVLDPENTTSTSYRPAIKYEESPRFVDFCYGVPESTPFYPEATALAYVLLQAQDKGEELISPDARKRVKEALKDLGHMNEQLPGNGDFYVDSLAYSPAVAPEALQETTEFLGNLFATVDLIVFVRREKGREKRTYRFILRYVPPDRAGGSAGHWLINDVQRMASQ